MDPNVRDERAPADDRPRQTVEDWARVYEGLSEEQIEEIHRCINARHDPNRFQT